MRKTASFMLFFLLASISYALVPYHSASVLTNGTITGSIKIAQKSADCDASLGKTTRCDSKIVAEIGVDAG